MMNPFEFSCPLKTQCNESKFSTISFLAPILILMVVGFMMLAVSIETSSSFIENDNSYDVVKMHKIVHNPESIEYKKEKTPRDGTIRLVKGEAEVIHHNIKKDSTIILSRKNIEGKAGIHLIVSEIIPNEYFKIKSLNLEHEKEEEDFGEIYFLIL